MSCVKFNIGYNGTVLHVSSGLKLINYQNEIKMKKEQNLNTTSDPAIAGSNMLATVLNWSAVIELIIFFILLIINVWVDSENEWIVNKLILSDVIIFFASLSIYWLFCYKSKPINNVDV